MVMSLEGPQLSQLDEIRARLGEATPKPILRASVQLQGLIDPFRAHPIIFVGGLLLGIWLAGSKTGQGLVSKYKPKR